MTTEETKGNAVDQEPLDTEGSKIIDAYRIHLDIWKVQNDNYFKRVQLLMVVIQVALFTAVFRFVAV